MKSNVFKTLIALGIIFFRMIPNYSAYAGGTPAPDPYAGVLIEDPNAQFKFKKRPGEDIETIRMIEQTNKIMDSGNHNPIALQGSILSGQAKAQQMVDALKSEELQKAMSKVTQRGNIILSENPELKNPVTVVAGAIGLWAGQTIKLIRDENFKIFSRIEGRTRSGEFHMESPILNGHFLFNQSDGFRVNMNRQVISLHSSAEFNYNAKSQAVGGQLTHTLFPHVDLKFGTTQSLQGSQMDEQARIEYRLNF